MERFDFDLRELVEESGSRGGRSSGKRKWREIEALKERKRLLKELRSIDPAFDEQELEHYQF